jgi:CBS domain-containing protein
MNVERIMITDVKSCRPQSTLEQAGRIMADMGCGALPVVDPGGRVIGILTDRDVCMVLAIRNRRPSEIQVQQAMTEEVYTCCPEDDVRAALTVMRARQVRRLPVVDDQKRLLGILSFDDVLLEARAPEAGVDSLDYTEIATSLQEICGHRLPAPVN